MVDHPATDAREQLRRRRPVADRDDAQHGLAAIRDDELLAGLLDPTEVLQHARLERTLGDPLHNENMTMVMTVVNTRRKARQGRGPCNPERDGRI
jgi:hypothetical protein